MYVPSFLLGLSVSACVASGAIESLLPADPRYVVQIHSSRDGFVPPSLASEAAVEPQQQLRTQFMTTESGHRFECYLPLSPLQKENEALAAHTNGIDDDHAEGIDRAQQAKQFEKFARAASTKVRPMCLQYVDTAEKSVYEICPGVLIRRVNLVSSGGGEGTTTLDEEQPTKMTTEVNSLASFKSDSAEMPLPFEEFVQGDTFQTRLAATEKPLYTQVFQPRDLADVTDQKKSGGIKLQFLCGASSRDDIVGAVQWRRSPTGVKEPAAFMIASKVFCNAKHSAAGGGGGDGDAEETFTVSSLLRPLAEQHTCIKRNEGWWTYEFCFGNSIRQYHRDTDGKITAEFLLGQYDEAQNTALEKNGAALASDHVDATHDATRPAFVEKYSGGTHCKEFDVSTPRKAKVLYFCSQGSLNHHILSVKETQTCTYTIKISSPVVCDHPHFITEEHKSEDPTEIVHCVPVLETTSSSDPSDATTRAPAPPSEDGPSNANSIVEVEVQAT